MSEVCSLVAHILVMPATNAISERSFSSLRRVKNYLRSIMTDNRLNSVMLLHIHKEKTDSLSLISLQMISFKDQIIGKQYLEHLLILMCNIFLTTYCCQLSFHVFSKLTILKLVINKILWLQWPFSHPF